MVSLPGIDKYSATQLQQIHDLSPAFSRYSRLLPEIPPGDCHSLRHRAWMECVLATHFQTAPTETVCAYWSQVADRILKDAWKECGLEDEPAVLFALGKHGALELNLSSDIDLMVVAEGRNLFAVEKGLRRLQQLLHQSGEFGFCFRLDFDLRPGGKMGPLVTTPSQFQDHYWSQGETWERLALVRLRPVIGPKAIEKQITDLATRFSFRKFLDFTLLDDLKALRAQVHQKGFDRREGEIHLKLEVGGIRDIELFVHSLLILNGGKIPELQTHSTSQAFLLLKQKDLLPAIEADLMLETYWYYRKLENLAQSVDDRQTHSLAAPNPVAEAKMKSVDMIVSSLLGKVNLDSVHLPEDEAKQLAWLKELGFSKEAIATSWQPLMKATALSHKNDRDERARQEFLFSFVTELAANKALDRDLGLNLLLDFVRATRAKASFFTLLLRTPRLIRDLARIFCLSPYLGSIVASRPELLDHFILQLDEDWSPELQTLLQQMSERKLLTELWAANQFLTDKDLNSMFARITDTADSMCRQLLVQLQTEFPASRVEIITLGKWAGRELGLRSDLDFIFVTPSDPNESDFKVARRFISRLTDPSKGGSLYELDLRLRPSGQSGPLLVAIEKLFAYWREAAKPWERQAYLRARALRPDLKLPKELLLQKSLTAIDLNELKEIRTKLLRKNTADTVDIKYAPGGLLDIEFVTQTAILATKETTTATSTVDMIEALMGRATSVKWQREGREIISIYLKLREFEQMLQLSSAHRTSEMKKNSAALKKAAGLMGMNGDKAWDELCTWLEASREKLNQLDPTGLKI